MNNIFNLVKNRTRRMFNKKVPELVNNIFNLVKKNLTTLTFNKKVQDLLNKIFGMDNKLTRRTFYKKIQDLRNKIFGMVNHLNLQKQICHGDKIEKQDDFICCLDKLRKTWILTKLEHIVSCFWNFLETNLQFYSQNHWSQEIRKKSEEN